MLSVVGAKKTFAMKHVFDDVAGMEAGKTYYGPEEEHFGVSWRIYMVRCPLWDYSFLQCLERREATPWKIETKITSKIRKPNGNWRASHIYHDFTQKSLKNATIYDHERSSRYLIDGTMTIKLEVEIQKMSGFEIQILRKFDDDVAKDSSDVVLVAGSQEFHVNKMYLSLHSSYFKSLFSGNFSEANKSIIELKDIDPKDFQNFLELIHGDSLLEDSTVAGILKLADYFDAKSAIGRCERFLLENSKKPIKDKFNSAIQFKLEKLKEKCISELKTHADILSIVPEDPTFFDHSLWKELLLKYPTCQK
ncbi:unnamed protein product [Caenorhabditis nigoni]